MPCILPDPLQCIDLGGQFQLPRDVVVSYTDSTAAAEAELLSDHLRNRLLLTVTAIYSQVEPYRSREACLRACS